MFAGTFALIVGCGMVLQWALALRSNRVPELHTEPLALAFHLAGEVATAGMLLVGGAARLAGASWAATVLYVGFGMLFYTSLVSSGYFAQRGEWRWIAAFAAIILLAAFATASLMPGAI